MISQLSQRYQRLLTWLWQEPVHPMSAGKATLIRTLRIIHLVAEELHGGLLNLRAMSLVYTTLLSLVPLLAVSFSVLKGFGVHNQVEPLLLNLLAPLGEQGVQITNRIIEFVDNTRAMALGSLGLGILIFTVISLMQKIEEAFNHAWHVSQHRSFAQRFSNYLSVIVIGPVLIFSALGLTATMLSTTLMQELVALPGIGWLIDSLEKLLPFLLISTAFTFIYMFIPNTRVHLTSALIGGVVAAGLWQGCGWLFASFVAGSSTHAAVYSAFAALILFIIWLYLGWLILLIGASIAFHHQHPNYRQCQQESLPLSIREQELLGLAIMQRITQRHYQQQSPYHIESLRSDLGIPVSILSPLLQALIDNHILTLCEGDEQSTLLPAKPLEVLTIADVLDALRYHGEIQQIQQRPWFNPQLAEIDQQLTEAPSRSLSIKAFSLSNSP